MQCPHCQAEVPAEAVYCGHCGGKLDGEQAPVKPIVESRPPAASPMAEESMEPDPRTKFQQAAATRQGDDVPEDTVWTGSYSQKAMLGYWIAASAATVLVPLLVWSFSIPGGWWWALAVLVMWLAMIGTYFYRRFGVYYTLTTQRFLHERGLLWRSTDRIELIDIDDVTFRQGPVERVLKIGTIHISSSDKTDPEIDLPGIDNVKHIAGMIDDLRRQERRRRGLHIEAV